MFKKLSTIRTEVIVKNFLVLRSDPGKVSKQGFQKRKRTRESRLHARERRGKNAQPLRVFPQGTSAPPATETATPGSGYPVIQDPAQIPSANHRLFETRMPLLRSDPRATIISTRYCDEPADNARLIKLNGFLWVFFTKPLIFQ